MTPEQKLATINAIQALQEARRHIGIMLENGVPLDHVMCHIVQDNQAYEKHLTSLLKQ